MTNDDFTIGVEEEYQIIDPATRELLSRAHLILATAQDSVGDSVQFEHYLSQIEEKTVPDPVPLNVMPNSSSLPFLLIPPKEYPRDVDNCAGKLVMP